jgi:hypothetical protein
MDITRVKKMISDCKMIVGNRTFITR